MKRFWLILLSLGLVMAFSVSAFAVDVKVSGEYYAAGLYLNKTNVVGDAISMPLISSSALVALGVPPGLAATASSATTSKLTPDVATQFFYQRLRIGTDFIVSPCLKLVTRFDAMERIWGYERTVKTESGAETEVLR